MNESRASNRVRPCECGLIYAHGEPDDEAQHAAIHAEYLLGPALPNIGGVPVRERVTGLNIHVIDASVPLVVRRTFWRVAMTAHRSMPAYPAGYDGTITEDDQRMYVLADGIHAVGMLISVLDDVFWRLAWGSNGSVELLDDHAVTESRYKIARVWIAGAYRRKGLAKDLVKVALKDLNFGASTIGWEIPFTDKGAAVVRSLCPTSFHGCGDNFSLNEFLSKVYISAARRN